MEASKNIRVLLIDDETDYLEITEKRLVRRGYEVSTAADCRTGLDLLTRFPVDVVVLDMLMPEMDGNQCMVEIRKLFPEIGVLLLTGHASVQTGLACLENGANDYCLKPVVIEELVDKIEIVYRDTKHG